MELYKQVSRKYRQEDKVVDVDGIKIGGGNPPVIVAGPCAVESKEQIIETARAIKKAGAHILRGNAFKPRTSPHSFQGIGKEGIYFVEEAGRLIDMPTDSEPLDESQLELVAQHISIIHIGMRSSKSTGFLKKVEVIARQYNKPVLLKRNEAATVDEFLCSAEYLAINGFMNIILCLRGIRTYETGPDRHRRYTADIDSILELKEKSYLPVIFDPSHSTGRRDYIRTLSRAAIAADVDGLMVETHLNPKHAKSDKAQQVTPETLHEIVLDAKALYETLKSRKINSI